jgi:purine-nucleoside phosphorylase
VLTVSDLLVSGEFASTKQRERGFKQMAEIALEVAP